MSAETGQQAEMFGNWNWPPLMAKTWREPKSNTGYSTAGNTAERERCPCTEGELPGFGGKRGSKKTNTPDPVCQHRHPCLGTRHSWHSTWDLSEGILPFCFFLQYYRGMHKLKWRCTNEWKQSQHYTNISCFLLKYHFLNIKLLLEWPSYCNKPPNHPHSLPFPLPPLSSYLVRN